MNSFLYQMEMASIYGFVLVMFYYIWESPDGEDKDILVKIIAFLVFCFLFSFVGRIIEILVL